MKKQQILVEATELFMRLGYGQVSMDRVVKEAKVSKATLYAHFGSKNELFAAVVADYMAQEHITLPLLQIVATSFSDLLSHIKQYIQDGINYYSNESVVRLYRLLISEVNKFPEVFELFFGDKQGRITPMLAEYLTKYANHNKLNETGCFMLASQILDLIRGASLWVKLVNNPQKQQFLLDSKQSAESVYASVELLLTNYFKG
jgi:AcrR family transcriptional regulator